MIFDKACFLDRLEGDEQLAKEIIEMFLDSCPKLLDDVRQAVQDQNAAKLERATHALKGAAGDIAAPLAHESARAVEELARENRLQDAEAKLKSLEAAVQLLINELRNLQLNPA